MPVSADSKRALLSWIKELQDEVDKLNSEMGGLKDQRDSIQVMFNRLKTQRDEFQRRIQAIRNDL